MSWDTTAIITVLGAGFFLAYLSTLFKNKELKLLLILISFWTVPLLFSTNHSILIITNSTTTVDTVINTASTGLGISVYLAWLVTAIIVILFLIDVFSWLSGKHEGGEIV